jgi:hypothetical protein
LLGEDNDSFARLYFNLEYLATFLASHNMILLSRPRRRSRVGHRPSGVSTRQDMGEDERFSGNASSMLYNCGRLATGPVYQAQSKVVNPRKIKRLDPSGEDPATACVQNGATNRDWVDSARRNTQLTERNPKATIAPFRVPR